jgi:hypothetical protein
MVMKPAGDLFGDAGDRWMRSLTVRIACGERAVELDGYRFEELMLALRIRHLSVHPRTREVVPGAIPAARLRDMIARNWSSVDSYGLDDVADRVSEMCGHDGEASWGLA